VRILANTGSKKAFSGNVMRQNPKITSRSGFRRARAVNAFRATHKVASKVERKVVLRSFRVIDTGPYFFPHSQLSAISKQLPRTIHEICPRSRLYFRSGCSSPEKQFAVTRVGTCAAIKGAREKWICMRPDEGREREREIYIHIDARA